MNDKHTSTCERAEELISVLYGEASERETRDFELHLKQCRDCRAEFAAFAQVRESIGEWRDEVLTGFVSPPAVVPAIRKSAMAALRQFFDLSPLWLKGAVGFAALVFCVLAALAVFRLQSSDQGQQMTARNTDAMDTNKDSDRRFQEAVDRKVQEVLARKVQEVLAQQARANAPEPVVVQSSSSKNPSIVKSARPAKAGRPFSRAEREQLAAELRLLSTGDDVDLDLLGDRINR